MRFFQLTLVFLVWSSLASPALAQHPPSHGGRTGLWTSVGAGAGFGIGLWAGLTAFDDAINSERKVWTSAIVGAAAGGTLGYLLSRGRRHPSSPRTGVGSGRSRPVAAVAPLDDADVRALARSTPLRR